MAFKCDCCKISTIKQSGGKEYGKSKTKKSRYNFNANYRWGKKEIEERTGNENIYILYRLPNSEGIHICMMSSSMRKYYPAIANVWNIGSATSFAFFYNGGSDLERRW